MMTPPEHDAREAVLNARFEAWSTIAAFFVTIVGTAVLVGWSLGIETLVRVAPRLPSMNPLAAVGFVLCGFALALLRESRLTGRRRAAAQILAAIVIAFGVGRLIELATGSALLVDRQFLRDALGRHSSTGLAAMVPNAAVNFVLFGLAIIYFASGSRLGHRLAQACSVIGTVVALLPLMGYLYGADATSGFGAMSPMALHTSVCFVLLGTGLLIAPGSNVIKLISRADQGGKMVRRFFPATVIVIIGLGYLRLAGERVGWYETEIGVVVHVVGTLVALTALLWWNATIISAADRRRLSVESALQLSESALRGANEALALQVRSDSLTGVRNRMALDEELERAMQNLHRYETEIFSVLMIDVDYFKRYNDSFGHLAGDDVLRTVAQLLEATCRATDVVGRYGGEEFGVILTHTGAEGAREIAERLRRAVEQYDWANASVTVSIGIGTASAATSRVEDVLQAADVALYLAKQDGRNRVVHSLDASVPVDV